MRHLLLPLFAIIAFVACKKKSDTPTVWDYSCSSNTQVLVFKRIYSSYSSDSTRVVQLGADSALSVRYQVVADTFFNLDTVTIIHNIDSLNNQTRIYDILPDSIAKQKGTYTCKRLI